MSSCVLVNFMSARVTLGVMAFLMFLVTQMIRVNIYIAVVAMNERLTGNGTDQVTNSSVWNDKKFSLFMGAFYWSYWMTELPGGLLAKKFGGKKVMGISVTIASCANLLLPVACEYHYLLASVIRAVQGLALGVTWPVMHWLSAKWIPSTERSKFMTSYHGAAIGTAITYPLSGLIITHYGWQNVFYFIGIISLVWCFSWWILVYDSPNDHPRLTDKERKYLKETLGNFEDLDKSKKIKTPWTEIMRSKPFWAVLLASQALMWGTITVSMQMPKYFHEVHLLDVKSASAYFLTEGCGLNLCKNQSDWKMQTEAVIYLTGIVSGIPEVSKFFFALIFSAMTDRIIAKKILTITSARKLAVVVSEFIPAHLLILLGFFGHSNKILATFLLSGTCLLGGASSSGSLANIVDLSPNHAGILLGIIKTLTIIPGVISPLLVSYLTMEETIEKATQWRNVFLLLATIYIICSMLYLIIGSGKVQPWNEVKHKTKEEAAFWETKTPEEKQVQNV